MKMNTLSYGLMGLLTTKSYTGYDLMLKMRLFWHVTHSSIYPILSELEKEGLVEYTLIEQTGKPDKKIYSITSSGVKLVYEWLKGDVSEPKVKDEMLLKFYCIHLLQQGEAIEFIQKRKNIFAKKLEYYNIELSKIIKDHADIENDIKSQYFGKYILLLKAISHVNEDLKWCEQVSKIYCKAGHKLI